MVEKLQVVENSHPWDLIDFLPNKSAIDVNRFIRSKPKLMFHLMVLTIKTLLLLLV